MNRLSRRAQVLFGIFATLILSGVSLVALALVGSGWVTVTLPPGRYELICNLPGHCAEGMYTQLTVT